MSPVGTFRTWRSRCAMSVRWGRADMAPLGRHVAVGTARHCSARAHRTRSCCKLGRMAMMSNEAVRFYPLDQWQEMADPPHTRDMRWQLTFPWPATYESIACEALTIR